MSIKNTSTVQNTSERQISKKYSKMICIIQFTKGIKYILNSVFFIKQTQQMEQSLIDFNELNSEQISIEAAQMLYEGMYSNKVFQKDYSKKIITQIYNHISERNVKGQTKFYTLIMLRQLLVKKDTKLIGLMNSSTALLDLFEKLSLETDPRKPLSEKGKNLFPSQNNVGKKYIRLVLEMNVFLGRTFPNNSKGEPTKFRKILSKLEEENIVLPTDMEYYPNKQRKPTAKQSQPPKPVPEKMPEKSDLSPGKFESLVRFVHFKIQEYINDIDQCEGIEKLQGLVSQNHHLFLGQIKKFDQFGQSIYQSKPQILENYLKIRGFLESENQSFQKFISKNDYNSYCSDLMIKYEEIFPEDQNQKKQAPTPTPKQPVASEPPKSSIRQNQKPQIKQEQVQTQPKRSEKEQKKPSIPITTSEIVNGRMQSNLISNIFNRLQSRSKSPSNGFKLVKQSLQKQKQLIHAHPPRNRNEISRMVATSTLTKTGMKVNSIFKNPPNLAPPHKNYEGEIVFQIKEIQNILYDIKKQQGHRRFKIANFRNRYPLYENETIQVGFKTQAIFQQNDDGFNEILSLQLYFGNKTNRQLKNLQIIFEGDQNCLIYTNPRDFPSYIDAEQQIKHEIMVVPYKIPHGFLTLKIAYQNSTSSTHATIALPNSIIKMTNFLQLERVQNEQYWQNSNTVLKSDYFKLSHHTPPNSLRKYIPQLNELTNYSQFSLSGSTTDYQLYCLIEIMKDYECALKINIRPDMNVVIQLAMIHPSQDALKYAKFFLQTFQMILQENGN